MTMKILTLLALILLNASLARANADTEANTINMAELKNAYYTSREHHREQPQITIDLWQKHKNQVTQLPLKLQYYWQLYTTKAYVIEKQLTAAAFELNQLIKIPMHKTAQELAILANLSGILLSRTSQHALASDAYKCALKQDLTRPLLRAGYLNNLALAHDRAGYGEIAVGYYHQAIKLATDHNNPSRVARYTSNLGFTLLLNHQADKAVRYLRRAIFLKQQYDNDISKVRTGIYLLHALADSKNWPLYERYLPSVKQMAEPYSSDLASRYFVWVQVYASYQRDNISPDDEEKFHLSAGIKDHSALSGLIRNFNAIGNALDINVGYYQPSGPLFNSSNYTNITQFVKTCQG